MIGNCLLFVLLSGFITAAAHAQVIVVPTGGLAAALMPEHGFLPGKKVQFYPTIDKYDFKQAHIRVEIYDFRNIANLKKVSCSDMEFTNTSEFAKPECIDFFARYVDTLLDQSNAIVDSAATDVMQFYLEGIDARMIGFGEITAHGLCQIKTIYKGQTKSYCVDITDKSKHSPVGRNAFVTRKTATRVIGSAAMREMIEQFINYTLVPQ